MEDQGEEKEEHPGVEYDLGLHSQFVVLILDNGVLLLDKVALHAASQDTTLDKAIISFLYTLGNQLCSCHVANFDLARIEHEFVLVSCGIIRKYLAAEFVAVPHVEAVDEVHEY